MEDTSVAMLDKMYHALKRDDLEWLKSIIFGRHNQLFAIPLESTVSKITVQTGTPTAPETHTVCPEPRPPQKSPYSRRMETISKLEQHTSQAICHADFWKRILKSLEDNHQDVPFAAVYSVSTPKTHEKSYVASSDISPESSCASKDASTVASSTMSQWTLEGTVEQAPGLLPLPFEMTSDDAVRGFGTDFVNDVNNSSIRTLRTSKIDFPGHSGRTFTARSSGRMCNFASFIPIRHNDHSSPLGFLLLGKDPQADDDEEYERFIALLAIRLRRSLEIVCNTMHHARQARAEANEASRKHALLEMRLEDMTMDSKDKDVRFRRMTDQAMVGMFEVRADGKLTYANDSWFEMTGYEETTGFQERDLESAPPLAWVNTIHEDDRAWFAGKWSELTSGKTLRFEIRFVKPYIVFNAADGRREEGVTWAAAAAYAEFDRNGAVKSVLGTTVDISHHKWMAGLQERQMTDAIQLKQQQELSMDMTFHEIRNPLAAISLCAESVRDSCNSILASATNDPVSVARGDLDAALEAADTIITCVAHQKHIVDDVLTLAKLNSGLLPVAAVKMQPLKEVKKTLKMFESELHAAQIDIDFLVDQSYGQCKVDFVLLDPVRLRQILINLLGNAVKFTREAPRRKITVNLAASLDQPLSSIDSVEWIRSEIKHEPNSESTKDAVYIYVTVKDSGCGMDQLELDNLFQRFSQGSPKTHIKYGGSGLGLFICKELAILQGGRIGIASIKGRGSTLAFYIKATSCTGPIIKPSSPKVPPNQQTHLLHQTQTNAVCDQSAAQKTSDTTEHDHSKSTNDCQILLVEDNLVNQRVMRKQLQRAGYKVAVSNHGQEALAHLDKTHFSGSKDESIDFVLMDIEMPVMNGLECSRKIRHLESERPHIRRVPLIAITANARLEQQDAAIEAGFDEVIVKPFSMNVLLAVLKDYKTGAGNNKLALKRSLSSFGTY